MMHSIVHVFLALHLSCTSKKDTALSMAVCSGLLYPLEQVMSSFFLLYNKPIFSFLYKTIKRTFSLHSRFLQELKTAKRVQLMSEIISAMRVIKMYCWEKPFAARARQLRK